MTRSARIALGGAVMFVLLGAWGVANLAEGDWFIGAGMLAAAVIGLWSRVARLVEERRHRPRNPLPPAGKPVG